jgi:glycosyltransferase involved in cell wall biosynthesis
VVQIESLSVAAPTIATNVEGFPDVVIPNQTGWLVPPTKLAEAIGEVLSDPVKAKGLAFNGRELCRRMFDTKKTAEMILEIYSSIFEGVAQSETLPTPFISAPAQQKAA